MVDTFIRSGIPYRSASEWHLIMLIASRVFSGVGLENMQGDVPCLQHTDCWENNA